LEKEKRAENKATLHNTGRDVEDMQINLEFDRDIKIWKFVTFASGEVKPPEKLINAVISYLELADKPHYMAGDPFLRTNPIM
jgi:hypothetical protein